MVRTRRRRSCSGSTSSCRLDMKVADRTSMLPNCLPREYVSIIAISSSSKRESEDSLRMGSAEDVCNDQAMSTNTVKSLCTLDSRLNADVAGSLQLLRQFM